MLRKILNEDAKNKREIVVFSSAFSLIVMWILLYTAYSFGAEVDYFLAFNIIFTILILANIFYWVLIWRR